MYQLNKFKNIPGVVHGFSEIKDGNMSFDWGSGDSVIENRKSFLSKLGINQENCVITKTRMAHETNIEIIGSSSRGRGTKPPVSDEPDIDAMITSEKNILLGILTADCLPVIFFDKANSVLALAHLSRINSPQNFARAIVEKMKRECGSKPENIIVGMGPHIRKESYVFDENEFNKRVPDEKIFKGFVLDLPNSPCYAKGYGEASKKAINLTGFNANELVSAGVPKENIEVGNIDTGNDINFFSHYRSRLTGEPEGRMLTVVGMTK